jgi:hypothetical protein
LLVSGFKRLAKFNMPRRLMPRFAPNKIPRLLHNFVLSTPLVLSIAYAEKSIRPITRAGRIGQERVRGRLFFNQHGHFRLDGRILTERSHADRGARVLALSTPELN